MQNKSFTFRGIIAPVFTPFSDDNTLKLSIIPHYAEYLATNGITGVLVNGTTGEGTLMTVQERKLVAEAWSNAVKSTKQHLMIQIGGASLPDVLELAKHAESIQADSILCLPELYFKPTTPEELTEYLKIVSQAAPNLPLLYYHIPMFSNVNIHMGRFLEFLGDKIPSFVGIKFTSNNLEEGEEALNACNKKFVIFLGNDKLMSAACVLGIDSFIATSVNMIPRKALALVEAGKANDTLKARQKQEEVSKVVQAISKHGHWVETMKVAMSLLTNIKPGPVRPPLRMLSNEVVGTMKNQLNNILRNNSGLN